MQFNIDEVDSVASGLTNVFGPLKEIFEAAKRMTAAAGENKLSEGLHAHFKKLETSFNDSVRLSFTNMKKDLGTCVENMEAFNKCMSSIPDPNTSGADNVNQATHIGEFASV